HRRQQQQQQQQWLLFVGFLLFTWIINFYQEISLCSEMASELRFALKRNRSKTTTTTSHNNTLRTSTSSRASPKDSEPSSEHRFHPLGPPYAQYEFDPKAVGQ
ncbi:uncharacterized protein LOC135713350, partial [Ochlerotatus camptorhynchus]|uniref:uncharacterized protein LOC135713350 n=1 Tax=Ochlerotatus camptorhynchus TaxID=644619 RepID=UPI0031D97A93